MRHNAVFEIFGGAQPPKSKFITFPKEGYIRLYQIRDYGPLPSPIYIPNKTAFKITKKGDILLARYGASVGKVFWAEHGAYNVAMAKVEKLFLGNHIFDKFLFYYYKSNIYQSLVLNNSRSAQAGFNKEDLNGLFFPLPPLNEQQRIVKEIEKYEPLIVEYEKLEQQKSKLDSEIKEKLKKSIIQYAIQGKLVPQDDNDEPASAILERIRDEKKELLGKKYIDSYIYKGEDNCYYEYKFGNIENIDSQIPFDIPSNWEWSRLGLFVDFSKNLSVVASKINPESWVLELEDIEKESGKLLIKKRHKEKNSLSDKHRFFAGNVLYSKLRPYLNKVIVADEDGYCSSEILPFDFERTLNSKYAKFYLMSPFFVSYAMRDAYGVKMPRVGSKQGNMALIPIPPLQEQERIVNKINKIIIKI